MNTAQIEQSVRRLYEAQQEKKKFDQYYDEVRKEKTMSYLDDKHIKKILNAYTNFKSISEFSKVEKIETILKDKNARLSVELFVKDTSVSANQNSFANIVNVWENSTEQYA